MKTILSVILLSMFGAVTSFAQNTDHVPTPVLCGAAKSGDVLSYADIAKCEELTSPYKEVKIKSFVLAYTVTGADGNAVFVEYNNTGGKFGNDIKEALKTLEAKKVKKVLIENVLVIDKDGSERKMKGLDVVLK
jgi:hypothetical protein